mmetsp:Transcript_103630/g.292469  ORF Transcript_103630/g.292469 Transcript_103630/m.292469 type:complete len:307 (+) Transcript_103630:417-1337(+)
MASLPSFSCWPRFIASRSFASSARTSARSRSRPTTSIWARCNASSISMQCWPMRATSSPCRDSCASINVRCSSTTRFVSSAKRCASSEAYRDFSSTRCWASFSKRTRSSCQALSSEAVLVRSSSKWSCARFRARWDSTNCCSSSAMDLARMSSSSSSCCSLLLISIASIASCLSVVIFECASFATSLFLTVNNWFVSCSISFKVTPRSRSACNSLIFAGLKSWKSDTCCKVSAKTLSLVCKNDFKVCSFIVKSCNSFLRAASSLGSEAAEAEMSMASTAILNATASASLCGHTKVGLCSSFAFKIS